MERIELSASILPRWRSTTELHRQKVWVRSESNRQDQEDSGFTDRSRSLRDYAPLLLKIKKTHIFACSHLSIF
jgi:hypothetical protein